MAARKTKDGKWDKRNGNQFWRNIDPSDLGRNPKYRKPEEMWTDAREFFAACDVTPFKKIESGTSAKQGKFKKTTEHKIPYTWYGLYVFLGVCDLEHYKGKKVFSKVLTHIDNTIRNQKYTGAAAGIFNPVIIARDLGLKDEGSESKTTITVKVGE